MAKTDYDIDSRLQIFVLLDSIEAAARKNDPSRARQAHEKMTLWMTTDHLSYDHPWKLLDIALRQVFELAGGWVRGDASASAETVEDAGKRAVSLLTK